MLHACLYTICFVFCYTSWRFYVFSETNLLTRCHSASSLFSAIFVFQKSYTGNILGIGQNKSRNSYFSRTKDKDRRRAGGGPEGRHTRGGAPPSWPCQGVVWPPGGPLTPPLHLFKASQSPNPKSIGNFPEEARSSAAATDKFRGT
jgi:hypothetical protein